MPLYPPDFALTSRRGVLLLIVVSIFAFGLLSAARATRQRNHAAACAWHSVAQPSTLYRGQGPKSQYGAGADVVHLNAVAAVAHNDVWAVGSYEWTDGDGPDAPLIEHWDGRRWAVIPDNAPKSSTLFGVAASDATDVWAVGKWETDRDGNYTAHPLIEHWDGHEWSVVPANAPKLPPRSFFRSVTAIGPKNVWAVGGSDAGDAGQAGLIEHWDGSRWQAVRSPVSPAPLSSVSASSPTDVWALSPTEREGIVERWNGRVWKSYGPTVGRSVFALSRRAAWAVDGDEPAAGPAVEYWNGRVWKVVKSPNAYLTGIVALSARDAWAVGANRVLHWDGKRWSLVRTPDADLNAVGDVSASDVWAVGDAFTFDGVAKSNALVLHYSCS